MGFLYPGMLAGLLGLSVPVILHLIARHRFPVIGFPSIRFIRKDDRTNVLAAKLIDIPQLLLRLLVLFLLVLTMSRCVSPSGFGAKAARNLVVIVDASASMRTTVSANASEQISLFERARKKAAELLGEIQAPSQCALLSAEQDLRTLAPLSPSSNVALAELPGLQAIDGPGCGLVQAVGHAAEMVCGRREARSQIVVLTNMRASSFEQRNARELARLTEIRATMGDKLQLVFVDVSSGVKLENVGFSDAHVRDRLAKIGDDAHVIGTLVNSGSLERTAKVRVDVGEKQEPTIKEIVIAPGAEAVVDMPVRVNRAVRTFARLKIDIDAFADDDTFSVPLNVADARRVLIVNGSVQGTPDRQPSALSVLGNGGAPPAAAESEAGADGATILRYVLNPGRELGLAHGTGIDTTVVSPEALAGQTLSKYECVILYDVSSLPDAVLQDLDAFTREGRALLFVCSAGCNALQFNRSFGSASGTRRQLAPAQLGNDISFETPAGIQLPNSHPLFAPFRDRLQGDLSVIHFTKIRELGALADGTTALFRTSNEGKRPLAVEQPLGRGRVVMTTFGVELERGSIAKARVFPALIWRLVDYLTGQLRARAPDIFTALRPAILDASEAPFAFANELELTRLKSTEKEIVPAPLRLSLRQDGTIAVPGLPAGRYSLTKAREPGAAETLSGYSRNISVQLDPLESQMARMEDASLTGVFGAGARSIDCREPLPASTGGSEWTRIGVIALLIAYIAESFFSWLTSLRRARQRAGGDAA